MTAISDQGISDQRFFRSWRTPLVLAGLVFGWLLLMYWKTAWSMVTTWDRSETFAHGFFVLPIVFWLVWRKREALGDCRPGPGRGAAMLLLLAGSAWLAGELLFANAVSQAAFIGLAILAVPALLGWPVAREFAFPLGFLFFAVPVGEFMMPLLMDWTAKVTVMGLRLTGVPVYQEGRDFVIPSGKWSVVEACSGIRYLIASLMAGTLFAYLNFRSLRRRLFFVAFSIAVPVVANWLRAYLIVMIGHLSGNELATGADHLIYGWLFFGMVVTLMFVAGARWRDPDDGAPPRLRAERSQREIIPDGKPGWGRAALVALVAAVPVLGAGAVEEANRAGPPTLGAVAPALAAYGWQRASDFAADWQPAYKDAGDGWRQAFDKDGRTVGLQVAYYRNQSPDRKLIASSNGLVRGDDREWAVAPAGRRAIVVGEDSVAADAIEIRPRGGRGNAPGLVAWKWYWIAGRLTASAPLAKIYTAWSRLLGQGDDSAVVILYAPAGEAGGGEAALLAFSQSAGAAINHLLNEARSRR